MVRFNFAGRSALSFISFNLGWWVCAFGAMKGYPWVGPAVLPLFVGLHLILSPTPAGELIFFVLLAAVGFILDSALINLGLFSVNGGAGMAPAWLVAMWVLMGLTYESMLSWRSKTWLLILCGAVSGPLTYVWCEAVNLLAYERPLWISVGGHALFWGALTPALFVLRDISLMAIPKPISPAPPEELARLLRALEQQAPSIHPPPAAAPQDWQEPPDRHTSPASTTLH